MQTANQTDFIVAERERIRREYQRRATEISADRYAGSQPAAQFMTERRNRKAADMLGELGVFPQPETACLEVGCGSVGWLSELRDWGVNEKALYGIDLDSARIKTAKTILPGADIRVGDAVELPWTSNKFGLVIVSTLFTSILDSNVRTLVAGEIFRVLAPGGALLWYDFAYNNPRNPNVRGIKRRELATLFPNLRGQIRKVTLAPPLTRLIAPLSWSLASALETISPLRTHLLAVLLK